MSWFFHILVHPSTYNKPYIWGLPILLQFITIKSLTVPSGVWWFIWYTFDESLNTIIEIAANCCWLTCNQVTLFSPSFHAWHIYSLLSINYQSYLIKLGLFCLLWIVKTKTMLVHLVDVPWLVNLYSVLQNMLECSRLFRRCSSLHPIWSSLYIII